MRFRSLTLHHSSDLTNGCDFENYGHCSPSVSAHRYPSNSLSPSTVKFAFHPANRYKAFPFCVIRFPAMCFPISPSSLDVGRLVLRHELTQTPPSPMPLSSQLAALPPCLVFTLPPLSRTNFTYCPLSFRSFFAFIALLVPPPLATRPVSSGTAPLQSPHVTPQSCCIAFRFRTSRRPLPHLEGFSIFCNPGHHGSVEITLSVPRYIAENAPDDPPSPLDRSLWSPFLINPPSTRKELSPHFSC